MDEMATSAGLMMILGTSGGLPHIGIYYYQQFSLGEEPIESLAVAWRNTGKRGRKRRQAEPARQDQLGKSSKQGMTLMTLPRKQGLG